MLEFSIARSASASAVNLATIVPPLSSVYSGESSAEINYLKLISLSSVSSMTNFSPRERMP